MDPNGLINDVSQFVFFQTINDFLRTEIDIFQWNMLQSTTMWVGSLALLLLTMWILIQSYRIVTGQSKEPMMALVGNSLRSALIIGLATSMAAGSSQLYWTLSDGMSSAITEMVTGNNASPFQSIDNNLALMQGGMAIVDALDAGGNDKLESEKTQDKWFTGIGIAGPGVIAGCMLLLNKIALALFIGFGPLFIMTLMFEQTKSFFSKWLFYGMGTLFSLAVLSVMVGIAMKMVGAVSAAFIANYLTTMAQGGNPSDGINSMAMQQGGLGLILTTLIISAPPMAAAFFQGTLGQIMTYSPFGNIGRASESKQPGMPGYLPPQPNQALPSERVAQNTFANHSGAGPNNSPATNGDYVKQSPMQSGGQQQ